MHPHIFEQVELALPEMRVKTELKRGKSLCGRSLKEIIVSAGRAKLSKDRDDEENPENSENINNNAETNPDGVAKINSSGSIQFKFTKMKASDSADVDLALMPLSLMRKRSRRAGLFASHNIFNLNANTAGVKNNKPDLLENLERQDVTRNLPLPPIKEDKVNTNLPLAKSLSSEQNVSSELIPLGAMGDLKLSQTEINFNLDQPSETTVDEGSIPLIHIPSAGIFASDASEQPNNASVEQENAPQSPKSSSNLSGYSNYDIFYRFKQKGVDTRQNDILEHDMFSDDSGDIIIVTKFKPTSRFMMEPEPTSEDEERNQKRTKHHAQFTAMMNQYKKRHRKLKSSTMNNPDDDEELKKRRKHHHREEPYKFRDDEDGPRSPKPNRLHHNHKYGHHKYLKYIY